MLSSICIVDTADYDATELTVVFPADEGRTLVTDIAANIRIVDDNIDEAPEEYLVIHLQAVASSVTQLSLLVIGANIRTGIIEDDDGESLSGQFSCQSTMQTHSHHVINNLRLSI